MNGFFITGTGTEVGKTVVTALLTLGLNHKGIRCYPVKPVASGGVWIEGELISDDAVQYQRLAKLSEPLKQLNPFCLEYPASPHFAAEWANTVIPVQQLIDETKTTAERYDAVLIEGAGGWLVPLQDKVLMRDMAREFGLPIIVVAANVLGTINHTLLTVESIRQSGQTVAGVIFTDSTADGDPQIAKNNIQTIIHTAEVRFLGTIPLIPQPVLEEPDSNQLWHCIKDNIEWNSLTRLLHTTGNS